MSKLQNKDIIITDIILHYYRHIIIKTLQTLSTHTLLGTAAKCAFIVEKNALTGA